MLSTLAMASLAALVPAFQYAAEELSQSGFSTYFLLLFSDSRIVLANWQSFGLSLMESLPMVEITIMLSAMFVFLFSLKQVVNCQSPLRWST